MTVSRSLGALMLATFAMGGAVAQDSLPVTPVPSSQLEASGLTPPTVLSQGYAPGGEDVLVSKLLGETVFTSAEDDAAEIGTIKDLVVTSGQGLSAVVIGVGGFLGVGEKDVAVDFVQLEWAARPDGTRRWVLPTTADALSAAPAFIWGESEETTGEPALSPAQEQQQLVEGDPNAVPIDPALTTDQPPEATAAEPLDRSGFSEFDESGLTPDELRGIGVYGLNDQLIGSIGDVVTAASGGIDAVIVDVGGFLGLGAKPVAVAYENLVFSADTFGNRYLFLNTTREQLEAQAAYDPATYPQARDTQRMVITP